MRNSMLYFSYGKGQHHYNRGSTKYRRYKQRDGALLVANLAMMRTKVTAQPVIDRINERAKAIAKNIINARSWLALRHQ